MNKKAFISIYGILIMYIVFIFTSCFLSVLKINAHAYKTSKKLHYAELYAIHKVQQDLYDYEEKDETFWYEDIMIEVRYEDITCFIKIYENKVLKIDSMLEYDDIENYTISYVYNKK